MESNQQPGPGNTPQNQRPPLQGAPPPLTVPQMMITPRMAYPRRGGRGWMVVALIAILLLFVTQMGEYFDLPSGTGLSFGPNDGLEEVVVESSKSANKVLMLDVVGVISKYDVSGVGANMVTLVRRKLKRAERDQDVKAVVLRVDSPGGEVLASDEIYEAIKKFQDDTGKPVIASMGGVAASGGYYVSAPCQWVVAHPLTITGSIGVIMQGFNYRGLMDKFGVKPEVYKSGKHKDMLGGMRSPGEIPAGEQAIIQGLIDETFGRFKEIVKEGRSEAMRRNRAQGFEKDAKTLDEKWEEYADGRVFSGRIAYEKGFVDELGDQQVAIKRAKKIAGLSDASVVKYQMPFGFGNFLRILGKSNARVIKVDAGLPGLALEPGLLYFMTPMFIRK